ncbi:hypothetical protein A9Q96_04885 [Rhodobacterales bacterium 52_120_T64]|nr:hypothetical protein A9Q96_04885 [Rhodobacterales bacterium 52_120_T64]
MSILPDLQEIIAEGRRRLSLHDPSSEVIIDDRLWAKIRAAYLGIVSSDKVEIIGSHTFKITTPENKALAISSQELPQCWAAIPYYNALKEYEKIANALAKQIGFTTRTSGDAKQVFKVLPSRGWKTEVGAGFQSKMQAALEDILNGDATDIDRFDKFLTDPDWSGVAKKLNRTDWIVSAVQTTGQWLAVGAARRGELVAALAQNTEIEPLMRAVIEEAVPVEVPAAAAGERQTGGNNTIYYGAPGTGKSHTVDTLSKKDEVIRTVFHPDVQNSDFVGTLKPVREGGDISYRFSPGPFSVALIKAMNNPDKKVWLIIEELNRAPAAAVFGDLFLLLDREEDGTGEYDVNCPNEEFESWFEDQTDDTTGKIRLPSNLWIAATMNSADQGVYPLDTAFRRRWIQKYIRINYNAGPDGGINVVQDGNEYVLDWKAFVKALNEHLTDELTTSEDKLVGPWFLKDSELGDDGVLPGKVLIYLWDDLLRHHGREVVFNTARIKTYGGLSGRVDEGKPIFSDSFLVKLAPLAAPATDD